MGPFMDMPTGVTPKPQAGDAGYGLYMPSSGCVPLVVVLLYGLFESFPPGDFLHHLLIPQRWRGHVSEQVAGPDQMF